MKTEKFKKLFSRKTVKHAVVFSAVLLIGLAVYLNYRWFYDPADSLGYGDNNMDDNYQDSTQTGGNVSGNLGHRACSAGGRGNSKGG